MARIVVIEDDANTLQLMTYLLHAAGHTVVSASTGGAGLELVRAKRPDLIVCDIQLPGLDGFDVARALGEDERLSQVPLVAVTALAMVGDREKILAGGFDGYLSKPITPESFTQQLEGFLSPELRARRVERPDRADAPAILVVDDHDADREYMATLLRHRGFRYFEARDGGEAVELLRSTAVNLVISDILMPTIDGYDFVNQLRRTVDTAQLPVIFWTAYYNEREARSLAASSGVSAVLTKPSTPEEVLRTIDDVLHRRPPAPQPPENFSERHLRVVNNKLIETTQDLRRKTSHLNALVEMNLQLASEHDPQQLLVVFVRAARDFVAARQAIVVAYAPEDESLRHVYVSGMGAQDSARVEAALRRDDTFADLLPQPRSFRRRLDGDPRASGLPAGHPPTNSLLVTPLRSLSRVYGWICVTGKVGRDEFSEDDEQLLTVFAAQVGRTYENGSLYRALRKRAEALAQEVVERKAAEAALREGRESFRYLFEKLPLPMWVYSVPDLKFLAVNDAAVTNYGYSRDEFLSMTLADIRPAEDVPRLIEATDPSLTGYVFSPGWRHIYKDGQLVEVDIHSRDIRFEGKAGRLGLVMDVSAHREAERQIQRFFEITRDVIVVTDRKGNIVQASPSSAAVLGYTPAEMMGHSGVRFVAPEDLELTRREMRTARTEGATRLFKCRYIHKDGHTVPLVWRSTWSAPDERHFFVGRDMTDYERTEEQLRQSQKMEAVGQLTGGVAHDFNNILMVILANVDALDEEESFPAELKRRIAQIGQSTARAAELTKQLLAFSRKQTLRPQITDINELVSVTGNLLRRTLGEQIEIEALLGEDLGKIDVDRSQLETALVNLCVNARDAMPTGGRLLIETRNVALDGIYTAQYPDVSPGDYVMVSVSDTGTGMSSEVVSKVFEPFFTTKEAGKGTGLGLSMVYGFVKQSNGHVAIYSEVGQGTSIRMYFPRTEGRPVDNSALSSSAIVGGSERILVVEDNEEVRANVVQQLVSLGYSIEAAPDGAAGVAACEAVAVPFDLLLTDVIMPGPLSGKALADEVKRRWPKTRVLFMSGYTEDAIIRHGRLEAGINLIAKPFRKFELAQAVRLALESGST